MKILKLLQLLLILSLYSSTSLAQDCDSIKMDSSVNIIKKLKCKAGGDVSMNAEGSETTTEKKDGILSKIWKKPEWMKKKN